MSDAANVVDVSFEEKIGPFVLDRASNGEWFWKLMAPNGRVLATSETYKRRSGALNGIKSARKAVADG